MKTLSILYKLNNYSHFPHISEAVSIFLNVSLFYFTYYLNCMGCWWLTFTKFCDPGYFLSKMPF